MSSAEQDPVPTSPEGPTQPEACRQGRVCGPHRKHPRLRLLAGISLAILLAMVLNDPLQPTPVTVWALLATVLVLGRYAYIGVRWLTWHSAARFTEGETYPAPVDWLAKLVPWIGFGVALPAALLGTLALLFVRRDEPGMAVHLLFVIKSLVPTSAACLALLPFAWKRVTSSTAFSRRDRAVLPVTAALLLYAMLVTWWLSPGGHGLFVFFVLRLMVKSFLPGAWPHHIIGVAVACAVLRVWFRWTGACPSTGDAPHARD